MGGDHKCCVCQATFTRPQHVARHMRSHTGDRPYKCQVCGDQFARSDLLSRHVNKCHPNERPPQLAGNTRRKGSASASRATTSKQSCDQCVQATLPCDGCNPCSKCAQKKCRCTYVKFHRQTAPAGPGHDTRPSPTRVIYHEDEYSLNMPAISSDFYHPAPAHGLRMTDGSGSTLTNALLDPEMSAKFRSQPEYVDRSTMPFPHGLQMMQVDPNSTLQAPWVEWSHHSSLNADETRIAQNPIAKYLMDDNPQLCYPRQFNTSGDPAAFSANKSALPPRGLNGGYLQHQTDSLGRNIPRRGSHDRSSDSSHVSSAASSSVHLPREISLSRQQIPYQDIPDVTDQVNYSPPSQHNAPQRSISLAAPEGFSSAFGLLTIDDPNVLAGLSNDGVPFFTGANVNLFQNAMDPSVMRLKNASGTQGNPNTIETNSGLSMNSTPGASRDSETRDLRDFWRAYLRTPLSGPGMAGFDTTSQVTGILSQNQTPLANGPRRVRVSSLPSVKTPTVEMHEPHFNPKENPGNNSSIRTTLHSGGGEDLRSYEAAVMARKAPMNLNLPRRRETSASRSSVADRAPNNISTGSKVMLVNNGFGVTASLSSSLATAFGGTQEKDGNRGTTMHATERQQEKNASSPGSSSALHHHPGHPVVPTIEPDTLRPSFKRLASQTLGPESSKRAQLSHEEGEEDEEDGDSDFSNSYRYTAIATADRRRRMSAPSVRRPYGLTQELKVE